MEIDIDAESRHRTWYRDAAEYSRRRLEIPDDLIRDLRAAEEHFFDLLRQMDRYVRDHEKEIKEWSYLDL